MKGKTMSSIIYQETALGLVEEAMEDISHTRSLVESLGTIHIHLKQLEAELGAPEEEQDADKLLQELVAIAAAACGAASLRVLPAIDRANP